MKPGVPDLVRNQQRPLRLIAAGLAADAAALILVECARALQRRIPCRQPDKLEVELSHSSLYEGQGNQRVRTLGPQFLMESCDGRPDGLDPLHRLEIGSTHY